MTPSIVGWHYRYVFFFERYYVGRALYLVHVLLVTNPYFSWRLLKCFVCAHVRGSCDQLLPAIAGTGPRVILADNHTAHHSSVLEELFLMNGHLLVHGPIHSPGFAPAEWGFSHGITFSQLHEDWLRVHPKEYPQVFAAGLRSITAEYMRAYFADAHFPVPGLPYKPYLGE